MTVTLNADSSHPGTFREVQRHSNRDARASAGLQRNLSPTFKEQRSSARSLSTAWAVRGHRVRATRKVDVAKFVEMPHSQMFRR